MLNKSRNKSRHPRKRKLLKLRENFTVKQIGDAGYEQRQRGGVALCVRKCLGCLEIHNSDDRSEWLWVRIWGKANKADIIVAVCYRHLTNMKRQMKYFADS